MHILFSHFFPQVLCTSHCSVPYFFLLTIYLRGYSISVHKGLPHFFMATLNSIIWSYHHLLNQFSMDGTFRLFLVFCFFKQSYSEKSCTDIISDKVVSMSINTVKLVKRIPKVAFPSTWVTLPLSRALTSKPRAVGSLMDVTILHTLEGTEFSQCRKPTLKTLAWAEETNLSFWFEHFNWIQSIPTELTLPGCGRKVMNKL